jgi:hypothetical protein
MERHGKAQETGKQHQLSKLPYDSITIISNTSYPSEGIFQHFGIRFSNLLSKELEPYERSHLQQKVNFSDLSMLYSIKSG